MTKFKVGDRVTFSGVVDSVDWSGGAYVKFDGDTATNFMSACEMNAARNGGNSLDTTFRDQAAIAAFQALHSNAACNGWGYEQIAISSLKYAEALDAERKKRDGGA